ncbi:MAG: S8 family serine peptidase [Henriciella sp.]
MKRNIRSFHHPILKAVTSAAFVFFLASCEISPLSEATSSFDVFDDGSIAVAETGSVAPTPLSAEMLGKRNEGPGRNAKAAAAHGLLALQLTESVGTGAGLVVGVWDGGGVLETHQEFGQGRVINGADIDRSHWHATHVAGTLAATGKDGFEEARGMVPDATIYAMDYCGDVRGEIERAYDRYDMLAVTNHSYAQPRKFGAYTRFSSVFDDLVSNRPEAVLVVAAGNSGCSPETDYECPTAAEDGREYRTIDAPGTAKNVITVGSMSDLPYGLEVENARFLRFDPLRGDLPVEHYSGTGPTQDGRIKPDVIANGDRLYSTFTEHPGEWDCSRPAAFDPPETCSVVSTEDGDTEKCYKDNFGTSMATPTVSGIVAVLQGLALDNTSLQRLLNATEVRALLVHTAVSVDSKPKYKYGWGAVSTKHAVEHLRSWSDNGISRGHHHYVKLDNVPRSASWTLQRIKDETGKPMPARITLVWNDEAGPALVNDLDIVLQTVGGNEKILPWTLDPLNPVAPAVRGRNTRDNVERIDVFETEYEESVFELSVLNEALARTDAVLLISGLELVGPS